LAIAGTLARAAAAARADTASLEAAAKKEGELTWYVSQVNGETAQAAGADFTRLHPGIKVNVVRITTQVAYQRVRQELLHDALLCDVLRTTDIAQYEALKHKTQIA